jgi:hypothetical protein
MTLRVFYDGEELTTPDNWATLAGPMDDRPAETDLSRIEWLIRGTRIDPVIDWVARRTGRIWFWYIDHRGHRRLWFGRPD